MGIFFFPLASFQLSLTLPLLHVLSSAVQPMWKKAHWLPLPPSDRISQPSMFTILFISNFSGTRWVVHFSLMRPQLASFSHDQDHP
ncbi:hypothetical protein M378DRAFT_169443 [Amanita muscaria Koide BX008]|uniref:Secreted protein n=1 Tax=Amanita muscaria (strain Koide BX008) TaxID=946122 RepID=A0A0C2WD61_AMAMK|nr:hypothetical protein M378DRAFT_169443 [Amanita muscaria Koide BX008]